MLRWVFCRNSETITCEVDAATDHHFEACLVPHWNVSASVVQPFDSLMSALWWHAEAARRLRESGWTLVDHVPGHIASHAPVPLAAA